MLLVSEPTLLESNSGLLVSSLTLLVSASALLEPNLWLSRKSFNQVNQGSDKEIRGGLKEDLAEKALVLADCRKTQIHTMFQKSL